MLFFFASKQGIKLLRATEKTDIYDISLNEPVAIIMGSDRGVILGFKIVDEKLNFLCLEQWFTECFCMVLFFYTSSKTKKLFYLFLKVRQHE
jgi:hypothetical protein